MGQLRVLRTTRLVRGLGIPRSPTQTCITPSKVVLAQFRRRLCRKARRHRAGRVNPICSCADKLMTIPARSPSILVIPSRAHCRSRPVRSPWSCWIQMRFHSIRCRSRRMCRKANSIVSLHTIHLTWRFRTFPVPQPSKFTPTPSRSAKSWPIPIRPTSNCCIPMAVKNSGTRMLMSVGPPLILTAVRSSILCNSPPTAAVPGIR